MKKKYGIIEFVSLFTEDFCEEYLIKIMFPDNIICCPHCGFEKPYVIKTGYKCRECYSKFSLKVKTLFENTKLSLQHWFFMIYCNSINKKNLSSVQYGKNLDITQKSAWNMQHKIRSILYQEDILLKGIVEVDEAFCSKGNKWTGWGGISTRKEPIIGLIERGGDVILKTIPNRTRETIMSIINQYVEKGSVVYTDGYAGYKALDKMGYTHDYIEHSAKEYVRGDVHTNTIENVWSFFKKSIRNAHHSISNKHMQLYLDETAFKFNNRHLDQMEVFDLILKRCLYI